MDRQTAINLISSAFNHSFNQDKFSNFVRNLFNDLDESKAFAYHGSYIPDSFKEHIKQYKRVGKYTDPEGNELDVLIVHLKREAALERARTMQRNFVAWYLKNRGEKDAAVVAYYADNTEDWRFSLVKMDYRVDASGEKIKVKQELTPARRFSFLVGANESSHTAQQQLLPILQDVPNSPTLNQIEKAFSVEAVTKQFYLDYRGLFGKLTGELDRIVEKDSKVRKEFEKQSIDTGNFAKKLLGQIVFLYFLQKKGWLGVGKDDKGDFKQWGTGPKNFIRQLFEKRYLEYDNFFNKVLEPLFYEALASEHTNNYFSLFNCKIPFLNGGLFEPIGDYNWQETDILISDEVFAEILDTFDRYNFTVREDEPLEKEVAVDPEMLGKVFENLLPENLRKGQGTYYTPREIVHYMCQESLINYLDTAINVSEAGIIESQPVQKKLFGEPELEQGMLKVSEYKSVIPREDIESFVRKGEFAVEHDAAKEEGTKSYKYQVPESIRENAPLLDEKLETIKICDPAIGSGAFPVGMMHEIVKAREVLTTYVFPSPLMGEGRGEGEKESRSIYNFKRHAIQNCLYGVDIDPGAIDIAKLRLWLSLIVDEENYHNIKPLPNLDYKIMQGNSLIEDFHGISLDLERKEEENENLFGGDSKLDCLIDDLHQRQNALFNATHPKDKNERKEEVENAIVDIFHYELTQQKADYFKEIEKIKENAHKLPKEEDRKRYYAAERTKLDKRHNFDFEAVENDLREMTHGNKIRNFFPWKLYFADVFRQKGGFDIVIANPPYVSAVTMARNNSQKEYFKKMYPLATGAYDIYILFLLKATELLNKIGVYAWIIPNKFLITDYAKKCRELLIKKNGLINSIDVSSFKVFEGTGVYPIIIIGRRSYNEEYKELSINKYEDLELRLFKEAKKLRQHKTFKEFDIKLHSGTTGFQARQIIPFIKNKKNKNSIPFIVSGNVDRYFWSNKNVRYMGNLYDSAFIEKNNSISDSKWQFWNKPKIIISGMTKVIESVYSLEPVGLGVGIYGIYDCGKFEPKCLTGLLNSKYLTFYLKEKFKDKHLAGGYFGINKSTIEGLPLVDIDKTEQIRISDIVDKILAITKSNDHLQNLTKQAKVKEYERQIDQMIYKLYDLSKEEIAIVEGKDE